MAATAAPPRHAAGPVGDNMEAEAAEARECARYGELDDLRALVAQASQVRVCCECTQGQGRARLERGDASAIAPTQAQRAS